MKSIADLIEINRRFKFNGHIVELKDCLKRIHGVNYSLQNDNKIIFSPIVSSGTLQISGGVQLVDGITVKAFLEPGDVKTTKVTLMTTIRPEHYYIFIAFLLFLLVTVLNGHSMVTCWYLIGLWISIHIWFQWVYRIQEKRLMKKIVKILSLSTQTSLRALHG